MHLHNICETITTDEEEEEDDDVDLNGNQDNESKKDIGGTLKQEIGKNQFYLMRFISQIIC